MKLGKDVTPACHLCRYVTEVSSLDQWLCRKKGIVSPSGRCFRFRYDPLKRPVFPKPELPSFDDKDFRLD